MKKHIPSATYRIGADEAEKEIREAKKAIHTLWLRKISLLKDNKIYYKKKKYLQVMRRSKINLCFSHLKTRRGGGGIKHPFASHSENVRKLYKFHPGTIRNGKKSLHAG